MGIHQFPSLLINHLTLIVGHIIVFQQIFSNIEVMAFYFALSIFDGAIDHLMFNRLATFRIQLMHHVANRLRYENAHQVVVQGQIKTTGTRIALPA